jgi:oligopeptide/dipeptide ABC transporter ATP-binding protein
LLEASDVSVRFPLRRSLFAWRGAAVVRAVDHASLWIEPGGALGLVGESGSGKTTLARVVAGLQTAHGGVVRLHGQPFGPRARLSDRQRIGLVFQDPAASLDPRQSVAWAVEEPLAIRGRFGRRARRLRALAALDACGLSALFAHRFPHELSGGQRQRAAIARALVTEPELLVCDEPTSALDVSVRAQIVNLLAELRERFGMALLFVSHDLAVVRRLCARIAVMYAGRIVEEAPREDLFRAPAHPYSRALLDAVPSGDPLRPNVPTPLAGDPVSPLAPPPGCAFHPRCPRADEVSGNRCSRESPRLVSASGARVACHLVAPDARHAPRSASTAP